MGAMWSSLGQVAASLVELPLRALEAAAPAPTVSDARARSLGGGEREDSFGPQGEPSWPRPASGRVRAGANASPAPASSRELGECGDKRRANEMQASFVGSIFVAGAVARARVSSSPRRPRLEQQSARVVLDDNERHDECSFQAHVREQHATQSTSHQRRLPSSADHQPERQAQRESRARAEPTLHNHRISLAGRERTVGGGDGGRDNGRRESENSVAGMAQRAQELVIASSGAHVECAHRDQAPARRRDATGTGADESAALVSRGSRGHGAGQRELTGPPLVPSSFVSWAPSKIPPRPRPPTRLAPALSATNAAPAQLAKTIRRTNKSQNQVELMIHFHEQHRQQQQQQQQQQEQQQQQQQQQEQPDFLRHSAPGCHLLSAAQIDGLHMSSRSLAVHHDSHQLIPCSVEAAFRRHEPNERAGRQALLQHAPGHFCSSPAQNSQHCSLNRLLARSSQLINDPPNKTIHLSDNNNTQKRPHFEPSATQAEPRAEMTILQNHNQSALNRLASVVNSEQAATLTAHNNKIQHRKCFHNANQGPHDHHQHQQPAGQQRQREQQAALSDLPAARFKSASHANLSNCRPSKKCARLSSSTNHHLEAPSFASAALGLRRKSSDQPMGTLASNRYLQAASNQIKRKLSADYSLGHVQARPHPQVDNSSASNQDCPSISPARNQEQPQPQPHSPVGLVDASEHGGRAKQISAQLAGENSTASSVREHRSLSTCSSITTTSTHSLGHSSTSSGFSSPANEQGERQHQQHSAKSRRLLRGQQELIAATDCHSSSCSLSSSSSVESSSSSMSSLGTETAVDNSRAEPLHPTVSALLLSSVTLQRAHGPSERTKPKRPGRQPATRGAAGGGGGAQPIKPPDGNVPRFAREPRIQDSSYFEAPVALGDSQTIRRRLATEAASAAGSEPPPRPWLEPDKPLAKRASLAGHTDTRMRSLRSLRSLEAALGRHPSIGELCLSESGRGASRQSSSESPSGATTTPEPRTGEPAAGDEFTALSYNVLSDRLVNTERFPSSPDIALNWLYRRELILRQLADYDADLIALQELEMEQFCDYFEPQLRQPARDYVGLFESKSRARTMEPQMRKRVDGCAIFYKRSRFRLLGQHLLEFNQLALANSRGSAAMINRVSTRDNIAMVLVLELIEPQTATRLLGGDSRAPPAACGQPERRAHRLIVCNTHIHWDPEFCDVKLVQTIMLINELKNIAGHYARGQPLSELPLVLLGDFNSLPSSGVTSYLLGGHISSLHEDFRSFRYTQCENSLVKAAMQRQGQEQAAAEERAPERRAPLMRTASSRTDVRPVYVASHLLERRRDSLPAIEPNPSISLGDTSPAAKSSSAPSISPSSSASNPSAGQQASVATALICTNPSRPESLDIIDYAHPFKLKSAYELGTMPFTNYTTKFKATIDYIFYSQQSLRLLGLLGPLDKRWLRGHKIRGFPQLHFPSDHLPLLVKFKLISPATPANQRAAAAVPASAAATKNTNHPAGKQPLPAESLTLRQSIKKSNKKQKHAPRRDRVNDLAAFNHKEPDHEHSIESCSGASAPSEALASAQQQAFLAAIGSRPQHRQQQQQHKQRTFWPKKLAAAGHQADRLSERIKVSERWSR